MITYHNEYGILELIPSDYVDISTILVATTPDEFKFDLETAEKIALISENARIQLTFGYPNLKDAIVVHHTGPRTAAVCRIHRLEFTSGVNPREEIELHAKREPRILV